MIYDFDLKLQDDKMLALASRGISLVKRTPNFIRNLSSQHSIETKTLFQQWHATATITGTVLGGMVGIYRGYTDPVLSPVTGTDNLIGRAFNFIFQTVSCSFVGYTLGLFVPIVGPVWCFFLIRERMTSRLYERQRQNERFYLKSKGDCHIIKQTNK